MHAGIWCDVDDKGHRDAGNEHVWHDEHLEREMPSSVLVPCDAVFIAVDNCCSQPASGDQTYDDGLHDADNICRISRSSSFSSPGLYPACRISTWPVESSK